jgi:hypothetical protein
VIASGGFAPGGDRVGQRLGQCDEVGGLGDEVGLALELDQAHGVVVGGDGDGALGVLTVGAVVGLAQAPLAQQLLGALGVAVGLLEGLLGVHHPCASGLAQGLYILGGEVGHRASGLLGFGGDLGGGLGLIGGGGLGGRVVGGAGGGLRGCGVAGAGSGLRG